MFNSYYELKIIGKDVRRFIKKIYNYGIYIENIEIRDKCAYIKVSKKDYENIKRIKTVYEIKIIKLYGLIKIIDIVKRHLIFIIVFCIGYFYLLLLSNIIFDVEVVHSKREIRGLLYNELNTYGIKKFNLVKSYKEKEKIVEKILNNNKENIEWLEINRIGSTYEIRVEERIIKNKSEELPKRNLIAKKSGIITKIEASHGEIKKKIGDYVKKGDVIVSGLITKNDKIKNTISAKGLVYAEVWYKTTIDMPLYYKEVNYTSNKSKRLKIKFFDKEAYFLNFNKYKTYKEENIFSINNAIVPISLNYCNEIETNEKVNIYSVEEAINEAILRSRNKIKSNLEKSEYIIKEKIINTVEHENYVSVEVFYKVCENITDYFNITDAYIEEYNKVIEKQDG
ncbi:MAG: sporulation protein YqfD [bacterium]|nr:sporulation protein YqfD [bacterium]